MVSSMRCSVSSPDETTRREYEKKIRRAAEYFCHLVMKHCVECLILLLRKIIFEGEIKDAESSSFSSDFQTLIKHQFPLYFLYKLLMSLRRGNRKWRIVVYI